MSAPSKTSQNQPDSMIEVLFESAPDNINADFEERVVVLPDDNHWQATRVSGLSIRVLEYIADTERMTALLKLEPDTDPSGLNGIEIPATDLEIMVQHGIVADDDTEYLHPFFIRQPHDRGGNHQHFTLYPGSQIKQSELNQLEFYVATGQMAPSDKQRRCINLNDHSLWLPGPVEHTEVMPLHMHNGSNSMLVRWLDSASFQPRLDPLGEELLVIKGILSDTKGSYSAGSWIRNPVAAWQAWGGCEGTLVYYKNGHFEKVD